MKRRLAWFMAVLMCVTSVPQGTFLSMAAEEISTEAETLQAEESEEDTSLMAETEDSSALEETETAVAETAETGETETAAAETEETSVPETVESSEPETDSTEEATEEPVETETSVIETEETEVTVEPETAAPAVAVYEEESESESEEESESENDQEKLTISSITLKKDYTTYLYNLEWDYENGLEIQLSYEGSDETEILYGNAFRDGIAEDSHGNTLKLTYLNPSGEEASYWKSIGNYKFHVEDCANSEIYGELAFSIVDPETVDIASLELGKKTTLRLDHGGRVWGKYSVEESGKYSVKIRGAHPMEIEIDGISWGEAGGLDRDCQLEAGKTYYFRLDKSNFQEEDFDVSVDFEKAQKISSLEVTPGTTKYAEHPEDGVDRWHFGDWKIRVNFEDGTFDEFDFLDAVKDGEENSNTDYITKYNLSVEIYQKDSEDLYADYPYEFDYWAAGEYEVVFKCPEYTTERYGFQILSKTDPAEEDSIVSDESKRFERTDEERYVYFKYTAPETGTWDVSFNREINGLTVEDEAGEAVAVRQGSNSRHYTLQLNQGETVHFIADAGENWKTLRVKVTKGNAITSVTLKTSRKGQDSYYVGIDELDKRDFYLEITYADGGKYRLNAGSSDSYGNRFRICAAINAEEPELSENVIPVERTQYLIKAYLGEEKQERASLILNCKNLDFDALSELQTKMPITNKGENDSYFYRFTPKVSGNYEMTGSYNEFCFYYEEEGQWTPYYDSYLEKGMTYLVKLSYADGAVLYGPGEQDTDEKERTVEAISLWHENNDGSVYWTLPEGFPYKTMNASYHLSVSYGNGDWETIDFSDFKLQDGGGYVYDSAGNAFQVIVRAIVETGEAQRCHISVGYKNLRAEADYFVATARAVKELTEGSAQTISCSKDDNVEAVKFLSFTPSSDGYYKVSAEGEQVLAPLVKVYEKDSEANAVQAISRTAAYNGYWLEKGKEYLIVVSFLRQAKENISLNVTNVTGKELVDLELIGDPTDLYAVENLCYADPEGARLKVTYADGTTEEIVYNWKKEREISVSADYSTDKSYRMIFSMGDYSVEKEIPLLSVSELPELVGGELKNVRFSGTKQAFRFTVDKDGLYRPSITNANGEEVSTWSEILQEYGGAVETDPDQMAWQLKAGETYYLIAKAEGSCDVSVVSVCEHQYEWTTTKNPTCTTEGSKSEICKLCGDVRGTETLPALGHELKTVIEKDATCGANGSKHVECSRGDYKEASVVIPATGKHTYTTKTDKAATCGAAGSQHRECTVCGYKEAATVLNPTGKHTYTIKVDKAATCGAAGSQHEECTVCGDKKAVTTIPATGKHSFGAYKTTVAATVLKEGTKERTCTVCGKKETASIAKLPKTIKLSATKITVPLKKTIAGPTVTFGKGDAIKGWKSLKTSVVTVNSKTGKLTGKRVGTAKVTVTLKSGKKATVTVTVKKIITTTKLKANKTTVNLKKGKTFQLKVTVTPKNSQEKVTYKSSNPKIATVTSRGKITAKKKGKAVITITSGTKKISCKVTVK